MTSGPTIYFVLRLLLAFIFLSAGRPAISSFVDGLPYSQVSLVELASLRDSLVFRDRAEQKDFSRIKSECGALSTIFLLPTDYGISVELEPDIARAPAIYGVSPNRSPPLISPS